MANKHNLTVRLAPEMRSRIQRLAAKRLLTESVWIRQAIDAALLRAGGESNDVDVSPRARRAMDRIYVRLRPDDAELLEARATQRSMRAATYASIYLRAHLRDLAPLPATELTALKKSVAELSAVGRNLNQIAIAINRAQKTTLPGRAEVLAMIKVCEGLRDHTKDLIKANTDSWRIGHA